MPIRITTSQDPRVQEAIAFLAARFALGVCKPLPEDADVNWIEHWGDMGFPPAELTEENVKRAALEATTISRGLTVSPLHTEASLIRFILGT